MLSSENVKKKSFSEHICSEQALIHFDFSKNLKIIMTTGLL